METMETKICKTCGRTLPNSNFKLSRYGFRVGVCNECATQKLRESIALNKEKKIKEKQEMERINEEVKTALSQFTPRQLMEELKRRGYRGKLEYIETRVIDLEKI